MKTKFKVGDYVWFDVHPQGTDIKRTIGRITEIHHGVYKSASWYRVDDLRNYYLSPFLDENQITPATDSEVAWYLVTNEN